MAARLRTPPSINTQTRIHKRCTRARSILAVRAIMASRAVPANILNMETAHALPAPEEFLVYPTPYFKVRNQWLKGPPAGNRRYRAPSRSRDGILSCIRKNCRPTAPGHINEIKPGVQN